jgi:hypothetical protein
MTVPAQELEAWIHEEARRAISKNWHPNFGGEPLTPQNARLYEKVYLDQIAEFQDQYLFEAGLQGLSDDDAVTAFERHLCKTDSYFLGKYVLGYDLMTFHLHYPMCMLAQKRLATPGSRSLFQFARDCYKTTCLHKIQNVQAILNDPNIRILVKSAAESNAAAMIVETKQHFWDNDRLAKLFPEHVPPTKAARGSDSKWITAARNTNRSEGTLNASGVGATKVSAHYDRIVGDDFWDADSVTTTQQIQKCLKEIDDITYLLQAPAQGTIMFIATRWSHDDPTEDFERKPKYQCTIVSGITKAGQSIFPEQLPLEEFYHQSQNHLYNFSCQIMLNPRNADQQFRQEWFRYLDMEEVKMLVREKRLTVRCAILTDYAGDDAQTSDNAAVIAVVMDNKKRIIVADYRYEKMNPHAAIEASFHMAKKWDADMIVYQKAPLEKAILPFMRARNMEERNGAGRSFLLHPYSLGKRSKQKRMLALQPLFQEGVIYFQQHMRELEMQIMKFPYNQLADDLMDALSEVTDVFVSRVPSHKPEKPENPADDKEIVYKEVPGMHRSEAVYRQTAAREAFSRARGLPKDRRRHEMPGTISEGRR